jgi:hypothetical protein
MLEIIGREQVRHPDDAAEILLVPVVSVRRPARFDSGHRMSGTPATRGGCDGGG